MPGGIDYTSLDDAYSGGVFKTRETIHEQGEVDHSKDHKERSISSAIKATVDNIKTTDKPAPVFGEGHAEVFQYPARKATAVVQESFTSASSEDDMKVKMNKILAMVEQNKTGYEPTTSQDMFLYILTGVMFLFTFDTFVMLGKTMRKG
jgi:hypothetical protein